MTGSEFATYVKSIFKRTDKDTELYQATTDVISDMRLRFYSEDFKEEAYTTGLSAIGDFKVGLPSDFGHMIGDVTVTETSADQAYPPLKKISKEQYDDLYFSRLNTAVGNKGTGCPHHYCVYGKEIFIGPPVDRTTYELQFNYTTESSEEVDADTDPVPFTDKYRKILRAGVLAELYDLMENFTQAEQWRAKYEADLNKLATSDDAYTNDNDLVQYNGI